MFQDLDNTIEAVLNDAAAPNELRNAAVSFETPDRNFNPAVPTVNLFLYELQENRTLRDPVPIVERVGGAFVRRTPPLRVDCTYLVTTWSNNLAGANRVASEHRLLAQSLVWLGRFPTIPDSYFVGGALANPPFPPPTLVAQMDANKNAGEFWSALGTPPRPAFHLTVTIALDLGVSVPDGPPVVAKEMVVKKKMPEGVPEPALDRWFEIGGTVLDAATNDAIVDAELTIVELERTARTNLEGRFVFHGVEAGNYTLRAVAAGFAPQPKAVAVPNTVLNEYDIKL